MSPRGTQASRATSRAILSILFAASLSACDVGQGIKTLGKKALGGTGSATSDADTFSINLAYRNSADTSATNRRTVSLQGVRAIPSANLVNECGATGSQCTCEFYRTSSDASPVTASSVGISTQNNSYSCVIPTSISDADLGNTSSSNYIRYVKLKRTDVTDKNTGLVEIKTTLLLEDVLGTSLSKTKVRGVFRYNCTRTFFEGEGVSASQITCVPGQRLGVIGATYNFYTYRSGEDRNDAGGDSAFPADICKRNNFLKIQCTGNVPDLRYGFYKEPVEPFVVGITMTRAPEGDNLAATYGYAALPDSAGNCPTGLVKVRPWVAQPASIIQDSLGDSNPPSSFINTNNSLNNTVVEQTQPANFVVNRQKNQTACSSSDGDCTGAAFAGISQVQSVAYVGMTPVVCAIPPGLLGGLF
jgi:hypothetical protein